MDNKTYINILTHTLVKKNAVLDDLIELTRLQEEYITETPLNMEQFEETLGKKDVLIENLSQLDNGFEKIYDHVKEEFSVNRLEYKEQIVSLQKLISQVMEKSAKLQAVEMKNRNKMDLYLHERKKGIKEYKINSKTASSYYKNMANQHQGQSYFLDKKK